MKRFIFFVFTLLVASCFCDDDDVTDLNERMALRLSGEEVIMNANDPEYWLKSDESLRYYLRRSGSTLPHRVISIERVTVQRIDGIITRISFTATPKYCTPLKKTCDLSNAIVCISKITEFCGTNITELDVDCYPHT